MRLWVHTLAEGRELNDSFFTESDCSAGGVVCLRAAAIRLCVERQ